MVRVLIKIFSLRVMAMRTSFSLTKSGTLSAGAAADGGGTSTEVFSAWLLAGAAAENALAADVDDQDDGWPCDNRSKMALTAEVATSAALGFGFGVNGGAADPASAAPRGIPRAERTFSTMLAITRRSGITVGPPLVFAAGDFAAALARARAPVADMR